MVRALLEAVETAGGARLQTAAGLVYLLGVALVAWRVLSPVVNGTLQSAAARAGLQLGFTVECRTCGKRSVVGASCESCNAALAVPPHVRLWARFKAPRKLKRTRVGVAWVALGGLAFAGATFFGAQALHASSPTGPLERLFIGVAAIGWAGAGYLLGRVLGASGGGPVVRVRDLAFAGAALGAALLMGLLAQTVRPPQTRAVCTLTVSADAVSVEGHSAPYSDGEVSLKYQLVESPVLGMRFATPLAVVGAGGSIALDHSPLEAWLIDAAWQRATTLNGSGVSVRRLTEAFRVTPGQAYEVRFGDREPKLEPKPASAPSMR